MTQLMMKREAALKDYLKVVALLPRVGNEQRQAWAAAWGQGRAEAGRLIIESLLPMVVAEAAARRGLGASFETLLAAGNRALARALPQACTQPELIDATLRHAVIQALKDHWMRAAEKAREHGHF